MTRRYKIAKEWSNMFECWNWYVYIENSLLGIKFWERVKNICENSKEDAEFQVSKLVKDRLEIEKLKSEGSEKYFLEL